QRTRNVRQARQFYPTTYLARRDVTRIGLYERGPLVAIHIMTILATEFQWKFGFGVDREYFRRPQSFSGPVLVAYLITGPINTTCCMGGAMHTSLARQNLQQSNYA
ncbi:hypothetical protein F5X99DRAFT_430504, partial [Biscogniauxia marginata]